MHSTHNKDKTRSIWRLWWKAGTEERTWGLNLLPPKKTKHCKCMWRTKYVKFKKNIFKCTYLTTQSKQFLFPSVFSLVQLQLFSKPQKCRRPPWANTSWKILNTTFLFRKSTTYNIHFTHQILKVFSIDIWWLCLWLPSHTDWNPSAALHFWDANFLGKFLRKTRPSLDASSVLG